MNNSWSLFQLMLLCLSATVSPQFVADSYSLSGDCEAKWAEWSSWSAPCGDSYRTRDHIVNPSLPPCLPPLMVEAKRLPDCPACDAEDKKALPLVVPATQQVLGEVALHWFGSGHGEGQLALDFISYDGWKLASVTSFVGAQVISANYYNDMAGEGVLLDSALSTPSHRLVYEMTSIASNCFEPLDLNILAHANLTSPTNSSVYVHLLVAGSPSVHFKAACYCATAGNLSNSSIVAPSTGGPTPIPEFPTLQPTPSPPSHGIPLQWACLAGFLALISTVVGCFIAYYVYQSTLPMVDTTGTIQFSKHALDHPPSAILSPCYMNPSVESTDDVDEELSYSCESICSDMMETKHYVTQVTSPCPDPMTSISV